ncbi:MAG: propanediol/glycerol family dehydratase medium subunit [Clostridiales bacterium]|jgi:hypothetical protein|nr:propanediol/glycerol family dehydratase medium subunit [Clostridiales bacterium]
MQIDKRLIEEIVRAVVEEVSENQNSKNATSKQNNSDHISASNFLSGKTQARVGINPKEVVIGVGPAFNTQIHKSINDLKLTDVLENIKAGIEEEGMIPRVVKVFKSSDVAFIGIEAAKLSGSGIGIGLQSKGTAIIHQKDLYPLSNLELFPQAPLLDLKTYRAIGKNAAKYAKGEKVTPIEGQNDPMTRPKYQVKAAVMHIKETELVNRKQVTIEW